MMQLKTSKNVQLYRRALSLSLLIAPNPITLFFYNLLWDLELLLSIAC